MWNSAEGTEVYANCLDLNVINADGTGGDPNGGDSRGDDDGAGKGGNPGGNNGGVNDADGGGGQAAGGGNGTSGAMIGGIIAGLACGLFAVLCIYRHRNRKQPGSNQRKGSVRLHAVDQELHHPCGSSTPGAPPPPRNQPPVLPTGWIVNTDPATGVPYYVNVNTGESSWTAPLAKDSV